jgi:hypothetical protein
MPLLSSLIFAWSRIALAIARILGLLAVDLFQQGLLCLYRLLNSSLFAA